MAFEYGRERGFARAALSFVVLLALVAAVGVVQAGVGNWERDPDEPVLGVGEPSAFDGAGVSSPAVLLVDGTYFMWYTARDALVGLQQIALATSEDGVVWEREGVVLSPRGGEGFDRYSVRDPDVIRVPGGFEMWYAGFDGVTWRIGKAVSGDGRAWTRVSGAGVGGAAFNLGPTPESFDHLSAGGPSVVRLGESYFMFYHGRNAPKTSYIGLAVSPDGETWLKVNGEATGGAVFARGPHGFDDGEVWSPTVVFDEEAGLFRMYYSGTHFCVTCVIYSIGYATSPDGKTWTRHGSMLERRNTLDWDGINVYDAEVLDLGDRFEMYYTGTNSIVEQIGRATAQVFELRAEPESLDFGDLLITGRATAQVDVVNRGVKRLRLLPLAFEHPAFRVLEAPKEPLELLPAERTTLEIEFDPQELGLAAAEVVFGTEGGLAEASLQLRGAANFIALQADRRALRTGDSQSLRVSLMNPTSEVLPVTAYVALEVGESYYFYPRWTETPIPLSMVLPAFYRIEDAELMSFELTPEIPDGSFRWLAAMVRSDTGLLLGELTAVPFTTEVYYREVTTRELQDWLAEDPDIVLLDVRTEEEYCAGHIEGAINIPHYEVGSRLDELDPDVEYVVYCQSGLRSSFALEVLLEAGFRKLWNLRDGLNLWSGPLTPCE
jgi:rhodanese-related sulfurtransferase/predicted GH43/DUF377 family glycosyl hydrolase